MKKKVISVFLCGALLCSMLAGCGSQPADGGSADAQQASVEESGSGEEAGASEEAGAPAEESTPGEIVEIIWQYPTTIDANAEGFRKMEDALNEMMERDIGVHVTFEPVGLMDSQNDAVLMVSSGEQLDVMLSAFTSIGNVVSKGLILPLDDYLEQYGQDILANSKSKEMCGFDGQTYGICTGDTIGNSYGYLMKKEYWEKYNLAEVTGWTEDKIYTMDEMSEIFRIVKEGEGDGFYCTIPWNTTQDPLNNSYIAYDKPSGALSGGVLMLDRDFSDLTVYNLFETPEYEEYCNLVYDWAQKGYISPDAAVSTDVPEMVVRQSNYLGMFYWYAEEDMLEINIGEDLIALRTIPYYWSYNGGSVIQWSVPITSANPEKAVEAVNYIYKNPEAAWLIQFGFEGEEYEVVKEEDGQRQIRYLADDVHSLPYYMDYGIWGDRLAWPVVEPTNILLNQYKKDIMEECPESRRSPIFGYSFVQDPVSTEIASVSTVIEQYTPSLNCGVLDPAEALPEFISALKDAGMDKIIEEQQRQIDEWAAGRQ